MSGKTNWIKVSADAQARLINSIPVKWRIAPDKMPPKSRLDVTGFPAESGILTQHELDITESFATDIVRKLIAGEWTSQEVTIAFCKRAAIAHQLTNCLTVVMFGDAIKRAKEVDEHFAATGKILGPLHGLPISLKDCFNIRGYPTSVGFTAWALDPVQTESTVVTLLKKAGAVFYVKTNVPTAMMFAESVNNCYGRTVNPFNRNLTSGGSSGGEAALIAMRGSCLGVGTDIGGSLRIPAACVGLYAIRPSYGRSPHFDARTALAGQESISSVNGPISRSLADLKLWMETIISMEPWLQDPKALELPYRAISLPHKLKLAVLWDNGMVTPTPPVTRALKSVVNTLKVKGYEIVDWPSKDHSEAAIICKKFFLADGGKSVSKVLQKTGEPWRPELSDYKRATDMDVYDLWQLQKERTILQANYLKRMVEAGIDAILGPTTAYVAPKNGELGTVSYTNVFSVLDYSSVSFPSGLKADKDLDKRLVDYIPLSDMDTLTQEQYSPVDVHGLSISLQLTAKRLQEEKLLAMVEKIGEDLVW
ncbi:amidase [Trichoderma arundinaceum]|uniref:amidase n=1 Tax=Trichoderma arundinaceum TaxID=490622 RepID=A0A395P1D4_TRIAR|nr:amidase [Trichoderma arundinaceum]